MKLTIENLTTLLNKINYSLKGTVPNRFIFDNKGKNTWIRVWNETIEFNLESDRKAVAVMDKCTIRMLGKETVMFGNGGLFIQLHNFDKTRKANPNPVIKKK